MEHVVLSHMAKHLSKNNIIDEQHGFRQRFSCETQLITTIHDWAKSINVCRQTDAILLDFSKAFDSVPHQRLLLKLDYYGIRGYLLLWIKAFLSNRSQFVSINGTQYSPKPVLSGVRTLVRPKLEYASSVWNPCRQHNISKIESVQRRAARFCL